MTKNPHHFEILKTYTQDWYLASDVDRTIDLLWERINQLTNDAKEKE